jgi:hypothetical protein
MITENLFWALPVLLAALFTSIITRKHKDREKFNEVADRFQEAFIIQLNVLEANVNPGRGDTSNIGEYLKAHFVSTHLNAFRTFKNSLSCRKGKAIDKAWAEYCNFNQYSDKNNQDAMRKLALKNLEGVLKFAKHK